MNSARATERHARAAKILAQALYDEFKEQMKTDGREAAIRRLRSLGKNYKVSGDTIGCAAVDNVLSMFHDESENE